jgi:ubiquinone/menaquinone biosynthesis C-methylase UbiE
MASIKESKDKHFPPIVFDLPLRRWFNDPKRFCQYLQPGQWAADLGCGPGFFTLTLAECVGEKGKVFAVDSDEKAIRRLQHKIDKKGIGIIVPHVASAASLPFIPDHALDFVLALGLLCCVAPADHQASVCEIQRILKPNGIAYLSVSKGSMSYVSLEEWKKILEGFKVEDQSDSSDSGDRWAVVALK